MAMLITGANVSLAWLRALGYLLDQDKGEAVNLAVCINKPLEEDSQIRHVLDEFVAARRNEDRRAVGRISTVADKPFPNALYRSQTRPEGKDHLYEIAKV